MNPPIRILALILIVVAGCGHHRKQSDRIPTKERRDEEARISRPRSVQLAGARLASAFPDEQAVLELHFIKVGQGDSTLIKCPNGDSVLIDCGSTKEFKSGKVRAYVRDQLAENPVIDLLVITHPDQDHYNKVETLLAGNAWGPQIDVQRVVYVASMAAHGVGNFDAWLTGFGNRTNLGLHPQTELDVCGPDVSLNVLAANVGHEPNDRSIVILLSYDAFDAVLPGDSTKVTQRHILDHTPAGTLESVEVLKVEHHGSRATSMLPSTDWFDAVNPDVAIFSCARNNGFGHPNQDVAEALAPHTIAADDHPLKFWKKKYVKSTRTTNKKYRDEATFITAINGNIVVRTNGDWYEWEYGG